MKVVNGQIYSMEQLGGLDRTSNVGLWFGPERPSHVAMTLGLTSEPDGLVMRKTQGSQRGEVKSAGGSVPQRT